ncbi:hypothetical protein F3N42_11370 [Marinihelvus fidelis]|uniref:SMP-30/Gluconolactonase/LRE-like region domain-containing protein n=1 Tax=Marinihelvus fidelis TaxID=2613842 RepID=A0A5N0TAW1_9GAMM|nr:hypothetical protein [Marinihelvus fidelis]KAA9130946.1 hypothetical protein F3N42_11370 [Marinihelvus fidelis]
MPARIKFVAAIVAASLVLSSAPAFAQPSAAQRPVSVSELRQRAAQAYSSGDAATFRSVATALHEMRPYNDEYMSWVVIGAALEGDRPAAYEMMLAMQQQGLSFDFNSTEATQAIRGTQVYDHVNDLMVRAGQPAGSAEVEFALPEDILLPTGIAWDSSREQWLVSDVRKGAVFAVDSNGKASTLVSADADNQLQGIYSLLVDEQANRLWLTSNPTKLREGHDADNARPAEIVELALDTLEIVARHTVPVDKQPRRLGGMVRTPGGDIYAVDSVLPVIYRLSPGDEELSSFLAAHGMTSLRGIALSDDGSKLYVADYEMGLLGLDLADKKAFQVQGADNLNLGGIEGLFFRDGHLVVIQNGITPQRIMRLQLTEDGTAIGDIAPLAVALDIFNLPDFGTMKGAELVFFANSHWVPNAREQGPVQVAKINVDNAPSLISNEVQKIMEEHRKQQADAAGDS